MAPAVAPERKILVVEYLGAAKISSVNKSFSDSRDNT